MPKRKNPKSKDVTKAAAAASPPATSREACTAELDDGSMHALATLRVGLFALRRLIWADDPPTTAPHIAARLYESTAPITGRIWMLATLLLRRSTGADTVSRSALERAERAVIDSILAVELPLLTAFLNAPLGADSSRVLHAGDAPSLDEAGSLLHEVALEELDAALELFAAPDGTMSLAWVLVPPDSASVELIDPLLEAAEHLTELDELLDFERVAAAWRFDRWAPVGKPRGTATFATGARLREWVLADRPTLATGAPVVASLASAPLAARFPAKQAALARAFAGSHTSFFVVRSRDGARTVLEDIDDGRVFQVHEHNMEMPYRAGDIAAGRLMPIREGANLRSPGMVTYTPAEGPEAPDVLRATWRQVRDGFGDPAIAAEALLSTLILGQHVPRHVAPARSSREAKEQLWQLQEALAAAGLRHDAAPDEGPPDLRRLVAGDEHRRLVGLQVDPTMAEYFSALATQAGPAPGGRPKRKR